MNNYCAACGKDLKGLPFKCRYCGEYFCVDHQLPENHACQGLDEWKSGKLKDFKKNVGPKKKMRILDILENNKWLEFLLVVIGVILLVLVLRTRV